MNKSTARIFATIIQAIVHLFNIVDNVMKYQYLKYCVYTKI